MPDVIVIVLIVLVIVMFAGGRSGAAWSPRFAGADILWTILLVLFVLWLLRRFF